MRRNIRIHSEASSVISLGHLGGQYRTFLCNEGVALCKLYCFSVVLRNNKVIY